MKNTVTKAQVEEIIKNSEIHVITSFGKTTIVTAKLPSGFVIVESSSCVDPANYDEMLGKQICMERIEKKIWELEGYYLQKQLYCFGSKPTLAGKVKGMPFEDALANLKIGKKVKRAHWGGYWVGEEWEKAGHESQPLIVAYLKDGGYAPAQAYQEDLLARDWEIVE